MYETGAATRYYRLLRAGDGGTPPLIRQTSATRVPPRRRPTRPKTLQRAATSPKTKRDSISTPPTPQTVPALRRTTIESRVATQRYCFNTSNQHLTWGTHHPSLSGGCNVRSTYRSYRSSFYDRFCSLLQSSSTHEPSDRPPRVIHKFFLHIYFGLISQNRRGGERAPARHGRGGGGNDAPIRTRDESRGKHFSS